MPTSCERAATRRTVITASAPSAAKPSSSAAAYHVARRAVSDQRRGRAGSWLAEDISHPAQGVDQLRREAAVDLVAQAAHQHVDDVRLGIERVVPDVLQVHRLAQHAFGVAKELALLELF